MATVTQKEREGSTVCVSNAQGVKSTRSKYIIFILINNYYIALGTAKVIPKESEVSTVTASGAQGVKSTRSKYKL